MWILKYFAIKLMKWVPSGKPVAKSTLVKNTHTISYIKCIAFAVTCGKSRRNGNIEIFCYKTDKTVSVFGRHTQRITYKCTTFAFTDWDTCGKSNSKLNIEKLGMLNCSAKRFQSWTTGITSQNIFLGSFAWYLKILHKALRPPNPSEEWQVTKMNFKIFINL